MEPNYLADIVKIGLSTLIIVLGAYYIIRKYFDTQYAVEALKLQNKFSNQSLPLKLQAYERLVLFLDRIDVSNMMNRLTTKNMSSQEVINTLLIAVHQEYDFNISQQLYVSENLWKILSLTKDQIQAKIIADSNTYADLSASELKAKLRKSYLEWAENPIPKAKLALKEESSLVIPK